LTFENPFHFFNGYQAIFTIPSSKVPPPTLPDSQQWSSEFRDFLSKCLVKDPQSRASAAQLLNHPFVTDCKPQIRICSLITDCMPVVQV
jgi:serine/threonine protein kinase